MDCTLLFIYLLDEWVHDVKFLSKWGGGGGEGIGRIKEEGRGDDEGRGVGEELDKEKKRTRGGRGTNEKVEEGGRGYDEEG